MDTMRPTVVWFRRDLRVRDHAALRAAAERGPVVCVSFLDEACWTPTSAQDRQLDLLRVGPHRTRFLLESLSELRAELRALGGELLVRRGPAADGLGALVQQVQARAVAFHELVGTEEEAEQAAVRRRAEQDGFQVHAHWDRTLVAPEDLPFAVEHTPETFSSFRKKVEARCSYGEPLAAPERLTTVAGLAPGELTTTAELCGVDVVDDPRAPLRMRGGAAEAHRRLQQWLWDEDRLQGYKETRNGMLGCDYSSRFSPWLAHGCVSARTLQAEVARYERERVQNDSTYWMTFELLWRDYFQWITKKHGAALFRASGLQGLPVPWQRDEGAFQRFCEGCTGFPIVDACMRELAATGFLSNRGRQIVTSFLTKNLGIDWRWGAEWFEAKLIDYDVASNYGNWNYGAGVGNDARGFRYFRLATQSDKYDQDGAHARHWCPELQPLPARFAHAPWRAPRDLQQQVGCVVGRDYPAPMVDLERSADQNRQRWERAATVA